MEKIETWSLSRQRLRKLLLVMKLTVILIIISTLQMTASVYSQDMKLNIQAKNQSLKQVFKTIRKLSEFTFVYNIEDVEAINGLNINHQNATLEEVLNDCLHNTVLTYEIIDKVVIIKEKLSEVIVGSVQDKKIRITGVVKDESGQTVPGANIYVKGTQIGAITDIEGKYSIEVPEESQILMVSFIGMKSTEILINGQIKIDIVLVSEVSNVDEVIVVGYGSQKKERIGSAIAQIKAEDLEERSAGTISIEQILGGQIKGVQISQSSGALGAESTVRVRGITSPFKGGNNQPLYVIDGVVFNTDAQFDVGLDYSQTENPLLSINPSDIESVSVLKDAGATAIYGSRGANGVIIINTKRGKKGDRTQISLDYSYSIANPVKTQDVLDAQGFKYLHKMIALNTINAHADGFASSTANKNARLIVDPETGDFVKEISNPLFGTKHRVFGNGDTNWQDQLYRNNATSKQLSFNLNGGNEKTAYSLSMNHTNQEGMVINDKLKRYGARLTLDSQAKKWLKVGATLNYSHTNNFNGGARSGTNGSTLAMTMRPDFDVYNELGGFQRIPSSWYAMGDAMGFSASNEANPVAASENQNTNKSNMFNGNAYVELSPIKDLTLRADVNVGNFKTIGSGFAPVVASATNPWSPTDSYLNNSLSETSSIVNNFQINYNKVISDDHNLDMMAGYSIDRRYFRRETQSYYGSIDDEVLINAASMKNYNYSLGGKAESGIDSYYSRLQYAYKGKYTATFNFRSDKSSKFGPGNKRAYFPSVAVNWNVTSEEFMSNLNFINLLRLRSSYGKTGSANVSDFSYLQYFSVGSRARGQYDGATALVNSTVFPNRDLKWETTREYNIGIDYALFNNRLKGSVDLYDKRTDGILTSYPIYLESGAKSATANLAEISNKGMEFELSGDIIRSKDLSWSASVNIAYNRNKLESIEGSNLSSYDLDRFVEGEPVGAIKGYKVEKIIQTADEIKALNEDAPDGTYYKKYTGPGDYLYKDINNDGEITTDDKVVIGNMEPDFFGGFSTNISYKGFNLGAFFQYSVGNEKSWSNYSSLIGSARLFDNMSTEALNNTWTPENKDAKYTRLVYNNIYNTQKNDRIIQDASYLRLKVLRLSYQLPGELIQKWSLQKVKFYLSASNLFTWTKFDGLDPEAGGTFITGGASSSSAYPFAKTVTLGVSLNF